jgi:hypothetical protein
MPTPTPQVGRRPPNPTVPLLSGLMWFVVGCIVLFAFSAGWHIAVGIACIGVGGLFVRGALAAARRQTRR